MRTLRDWLERHAPALLRFYDYPRYRFADTCWAEDCPVPGRRNIRHSPAQLRRCEGTPIAASLTERGWLYGQGIEPDSVVGPASKASA